MKITSIKQQVKTQGRYSIFLDEKYSFSLSELGIINSGLRVGQELTKDEVEQFRDESRLDKGYNRALELIVRRLRSEWEIRDYLKRKEYEPEAAEEIVGRLKERGYIDDRKFAAAWVQTRRLLKSTSRRRLTQELKQKRVTDDIIYQVLNEDATDDREVLRELAERKSKQSRYQDKTKLMQYFIRQGYNYEDVKSVLSESE